MHVSLPEILPETPERRNMKTTRDSSSAYVDQLVVSKEAGGDHRRQRRAREGHRVAEEARLQIDDAGPPEVGRARHRDDAAPMASPKDE